MQVKMFVCKDWQELETEVNKFMSTLVNEPASMDIDIEKCTAIIKYSPVRKGAICCECRYWDDDGSHDALIGLCQRCGGRKRFSDKACSKYEDVRG